MGRSDVIIVGAGIIGMGIARELAGRGVRVTLLERGSQPGQEASMASAGMLAPQGELSEGPFLRLCLESNRLYTEFRESVEEETDIRCYHREAATLAVAVTDADVTDYRHIFTRQRGEGMEVEWLTGDEARKIEPALSARAQAAMRLPGDRHVENRLLVAAMEQACRRRGVEIVCGAQATELLTEGGRAVGVATNLGPYYGSTVINAAGAWAACIGVPDEALRPPVFPVRGQMLALAMPRPDFFSRVVRSPRSYLVPRYDGCVFLGATMERVGFDKQNTVWGVRHLLGGALELFPELEGYPIQRMWAGLRPGSQDNYPVLGESGLTGYRLATGLFRNGLLLAPAVAQTIAELVTTGRTPELIADFGMGRFAGGAVAAGRIPGA